jgi:RimJ/RimL family protein N-acetyltransferase
MHFKNEFDQLIGFPIENWHSREKPSQQIMMGKYCRLELLDIEKHTEQLFYALSLENDGSSWTYLPYGPFETCQDFCTWLEMTSTLDDTVLYTICDNKTGSPIGIAGYLRINPEQGSIEVGHLHFSKLLQKTPAATEAMYLMMQYAFEELHYRRYEWKCDSFNQPSRNAAERFGFKFEGIFRQSNVFKNRNRDTVWFSIIDSEWLDIKSRFCKWLSPENFDSRGNQIASLRNISTLV